MTTYTRLSVLLALRGINHKSEQARIRVKGFGDAVINVVFAILC